MVMQGKITAVCGASIPCFKVMINGFLHGRLHDLHAKQLAPKKPPRAKPGAEGHSTCLAPEPRLGSSQTQGVHVDPDEDLADNSKRAAHVSCQVWWEEPRRNFWQSAKVISKPERCWFCDGMCPALADDLLPGLRQPIRG